MSKKRTRSQIGKSSKNKGSSFELKTARELSKWWGETFHRTPASGALHWKDDKRVSGDIVPPDGSIFPFSVECKNHEGWTLDTMVTNIGEFPSFWDQCTHDANEFSKVPMLIVKRNRVKPWVFVPYNEQLFWLSSQRKYPVFHSFFYNQSPSDVLGIQLASLVKFDKGAILTWYGTKNNSDNPK